MSDRTIFQEPCLFTLAAGLCRTDHRLGSSRLSRPRDRLRPLITPPNSCVLLRLLSQLENSLSLSKDAPLTRPVHRFGRILAIPRLGGLHYRYQRQAACVAIEFHSVCGFNARVQPLSIFLQNPDFSVSLLEWQSKDLRQSRRLDFVNRSKRSVLEPLEVATC